MRATGNFAPAMLCLAGALCMWSTGVAIYMVDFPRFFLFMLMTVFSFWLARWSWQ